MMGIRLSFLLLFVSVLLGNLCIAQIVPKGLTSQTQVLMIKDYDIGVLPFCALTNKEDSAYDAGSDDLINYLGTNALCVDVVDVDTRNNQLFNFFSARDSAKGDNQPCGPIDLKGLAISQVMCRHCSARDIKGIRNFIDRFKLDLLVDIQKTNNSVLSYKFYEIYRDSVVVNSEGKRDTLPNWVLLWSESIGISGLEPIDIADSLGSILLPYICSSRDSSKITPIQRRRLVANRFIGRNNDSELCRYLSKLKRDAYVDSMKRLFCAPKVITYEVPIKIWDKENPNRQLPLLKIDVDNLNLAGESMRISPNNDTLYISAVLGKETVKATAFCHGMGLVDTTFNIFLPGYEASQGILRGIDTVVNGPKCIEIPLRLRPNTKHPLGHHFSIPYEQIHYYGFTTLCEVLNYFVPNISCNQQTAAGISDHISPVLLRGLGPNQMIILVDGVEMVASPWLHIQSTVGAGTAGYDLNNIPLYAVHEIQIFGPEAALEHSTGGAAGVINIVTNYTDTGSDPKKFNLRVLGNGLSFIPDKDWKHIHDTNWGLQGTLNTYGTLNETLSYSAYINYEDSPEVNRSGEYNKTPPLFPEYPKEDSLWAKTGFNGKQLISIGRPEVESINWGFSTNIRLNEKINGQFSSHIYNQKTLTHGFFRLPNYHLISQINNIFDKGYLFPYGFSPKIKTNKRGENFNFNIRFSDQSLGDFTFNGNYGRNEIKITLNNSNNPTVDYAYDGASILNENQLKNFHVGTLELREIRLGLKWNKAIINNSNWKINTLAGLEFNRRNYQIIKGDSSSYYDMSSIYSEKDIVDKISGSQGVKGFGLNHEANSQINQYEGFLRVSGYSLNRSTAFSAGLRISNNYGIQGTKSNKINVPVSANASIKWSPIGNEDPTGLVSGLSIRGATVFTRRLPSMAQMFFSKERFRVMRNNDVNGNNIVFQEFHVNDAFSGEDSTAGVVPLLPENSLGVSLGIEMSVSNGVFDELSIQVDKYWTSVDNVIFLTNAISRENKELKNSINNNGGNTLDIYDQYLLNGLKISTSGLDVQLDMRLASWKDFQFRSGFNISNTRIRNQFRGDSIILNNSHVLSDTLESKKLLSQSQRALIETGIPAYQFNLMAEYICGVFRLSLNTTLFGNVSYPSKSDVDTTRKYDPMWVINPVVALNFNKLNNWGSKWKPSLVFGAIIPLGSIATTNDPDETENGLFIYNRHVHQFGIAGGRYFARFILRL